MKVRLEILLVVLVSAIAVWTEPSTPEVTAALVVLFVAANIAAHLRFRKMVSVEHGENEADDRESPALHVLAQELAAEAGIRNLKVFRIPNMRPNAFAAGFGSSNGIVAITEGLLKILDKGELRGVMAHEIAHIKNRDILWASVAACGGAAFAYFVSSEVAQMVVAETPIDEGRNGRSAVGRFIAAASASITAILVRLGILRRREFAADAFAARLTGAPAELASALKKLRKRKLKETLMLPTAEAKRIPVAAALFDRLAVTRLFSTHPPIKKRIARLRSLEMELNLAS